MLKNRGNVAIVFLAFCVLLMGQQAERGAIRELNNDAIIKLIKAGLSDDLIVSTINASPGAYNTSPDGLIALKAEGASDKILSAMVSKNSSAARAVSSPSVAEPPAKGQATQSAVIPTGQENGQTSFTPAREVPGGSVVSMDLTRTPSRPRVFLQSASKGTNRNAARDQSMEMSKDLEKECPGVQVTINQATADYTVLLNHIESGFVRDNQVQVANKDGDLLTKTKEGGSIAAAMKKACTLILADWTKK